MKAVNKYIIIELIKEEAQPNESGLILTDKHQNDIRYKKAKIYSIGNYVEGLSKGDEIYFDKHAGYGIEYKNKYFQVIKENDVVVVL